MSFLADHVCEPYNFKRVLLLMDHPVFFDDISLSKVGEKLKRDKSPTCNDVSIKTEKSSKKGDKNPFWREPRKHARPAEERGICTNIDEAAAIAVQVPTIAAKAAIGDEFVVPIHPNTLEQSCKALASQI